MHSGRVRFGTTALALCFALNGCAADGPDGAEPVDGEAEAAAAPAGADALVGSWSLSRIDMRDGEDFEPTTDAVPNLVFTAEADPTGSRRYTGSGGCNPFSGGYDAGSTGRIAIHRGPATTTTTCPEAVMRVERLFGLGLESARTYTIEGDRLSIDFGGGVLLLDRDGD